MTAGDKSGNTIRRVLIAVIFLVISALFIGLIWDLLMALMTAAILASLTHPVYAWLLRRCRGRRAIAAAITLIVVILVVVIPLILLASVITSQAVKLAHSLEPQVNALLEKMNKPESFPEWFPFWDKIAPYREQIVKKLGDIASMVGSFLIASLSAVAGGAVRFFFNLFVMLYSLFYFLMNGREMQEKILRLIPLQTSEKKLFVSTFFAVSKATLKGTFVIGIVQGGLAGIAFSVVGIQDALFWGTIMVVLSIIPGIGTALVWVPAVLYLMTVGQTFSAIGLFLWCGIVVGLADNFLRPLLVGKDTEMPDLLVMLSTFGGLALFGAMGLVLGPVIAALFLAAARIYRDAFSEMLASTETAPGEH